jgi:hypothetical protein
VDRLSEVKIANIYTLPKLILETVHIAARENPIVNRLNKTKVEQEVDHEAEKTERLRQEANKRRAEAAAKVKLAL